MIKSNKGITLSSLIITIVLMMILASSVVYISLDRFEINNVNKMITDIELLKDKVSNYYLKYGELPVIRDSSSTPIKYSKAINFKTNSADGTDYYILDLEAMDGITLNYGENGFLNLNGSTDVYIINGKSHTIYYVKGIEVDGQLHHYINSDENLSTDKDNIPPSKPQINIISGVKETDEDGDIYYTSSVEIEIMPGKDSWSGINNTFYSIEKNGLTYKSGISIDALENNILLLDESGTYVISVISSDKNGNRSEETLTAKVSMAHKWDEGVVEKTATCTEKGIIKYTCLTCGETTETEIPLVGHDIKTEIIKATCTENGEKKYTCRNCDYSYSETIVSKGHTGIQKIEYRKNTTSGMCEAWKVYSCCEANIFQTEDLHIVDSTIMENFCVNCEEVLVGGDQYIELQSLQ